MKKGPIISAIIGGTLFAIPYLAMDVALLPSAIIAVAAFGAGNMIFSDTPSEKDIVVKDKPELNFYDLINKAKKQKSEIYSMINKVEDSELIKNIEEIHETVGKIIETVEKNPSKQKLANNFFSYYLPNTLKFLRKYDEIENQRLNTKESQEFMDSAEEMMKKINQSFKVQLANLYKSDMMGTDAEMKVFDTMLKTDGIDSNDDFKL